MTFQAYSGTETTYLVGTVSTHAPSNGRVPKWNTGGTITWEDDSTGAPASGESLYVMGTAVSDSGMLTNIAASATAASVTWTVTPATDPDPDRIFLALGPASATDAGIVTASSQTIAGAKTFADVLTVGAGGVELTGTNGIVTLRGAGSGSNDEMLYVDLDTVANQAQVGSQSGIANINMGTVGFDLTDASTLLGTTYFVNANLMALYGLAPSLGDIVWHDGTRLTNGPPGSANGIQPDDADLVNRDRGGEAVITVQHRNGWCVALNKQSREYEDNVATFCGHVVICPWGISDTKPRRARSAWS